MKKIIRNKPFTVKKPKLLAIFITLGLLLSSTLLFPEPAHQKQNQGDPPKEEEKTYTLDGPDLEVLPEDLVLYKYFLSLEKEPSPDEYSRDEIENFLCSSVHSLIRAEEVRKDPTSGEYLIRSLHVMDKQIERALSQVISKWYEDRVTVTSGGDVSGDDEKLIAAFFAEVNRIIGLEKFVYYPHQEVANIIIILEDHGDPIHIHKYIGESVVLEDNMRVRVSMENTQLHVETYKAGQGTLINQSSFIRFTPAEMNFRKENRMVKILIKKMADKTTHHFALIHEMLHSIGFPGHSPFSKSNIFPYPVTVNDIRKSSPLLGELAHSMIEILYRPEIIPGMSIRKIRDILTHMKKKDKNILVF